jgi:signal transduction histidine kinase
MQLLSLYQQHYPLPPAKIQTTIEAVDLEFLIEDLPRLLNSMKVGAERIQKIVLSLRNFSRMDEAEMKVVDLHEGIDSTLLILQSRLRPTRKQIAIEVVKDYGELPLVECYAGQMNQVFMNLLVNAIDALSDRRKQGDCPKILIQTRHIEDQVVAIEISDNGIGIPPEMQSRIFDPFFTTKPIGEGTGLGLSISYQIMQKHQGVLACTSKPNQGTTFRIELPIQPAMPQLAVPRLHSL